MTRLCAVAVVLETLALGWWGVAANAEDIRLNDCEIGGADSFGDYHHMFRWPLGEGTPIPFAWGQFEHDGDEFCHVTSNTFSAQVHYLAITPKAYLELKTYHTNGDEQSTILELTPSPVSADDWRTFTRFFASIEDVQNIALPFPAAGVHFRLREHCGSKQVQKESGGGAYTTTIGDSDARFKVVSIGFAYGNWAANWKGMDFHPGDAQDNFDNFTLEHERATDYVEFTTQESGQCTIQAYCRKKASEAGNMRVKVNGSVKASPSVGSTTFGWVDLWTGELVGGDTIRIENNEWEESSYWGLSHTFHYSCVEFSNESRSGPAFRVVPAAGNGGGPPPPPPPPPPPDTTPPVLQNIAANPVTHEGAIIRFDANEDVQWRVEYGASAAYGQTTLMRGFDDIRATSVSGLAPTTTHHYRIVAWDRANNTTVSGDRTFTTMAAPDRTAPTITNVQATVTHNSATVTWTTNEVANSMLHYGRQASTATWTGLADFVTQHSVTVTGLTPSTQYTYWVRSADPTGNIGESAHLTFTTALAPDTTAPSIQSRTVVEITQTSAKVQWRTNEAAASVVYYGTTNAYGLEAAVGGTRTDHDVPLSRLQSNRTYHYQVRSTDAAGNLATQSGDFHTDPPDEGTVSGKATRQGTGANLAGATVTIKGLTGFTATTAAAGAYSLTAVPTGQRTVQCTASGYRTAESTVTVRRMQTVTRNFTLTAVGRVYGYVKGPRSGGPKPGPGGPGAGGLNGATVRLLLPGTRTTETARGCIAKPDRPADGYYAFDDVPVGTHSLEVSLAGYVTQTVSVTIANPGQTLKNDITLAAAVCDVGTTNDDFTLSPASPTAGQRTTLACRVTNLGNVEARNVKVLYKWGGTTIGDRSVSILPAGESRPATYPWTVPASAAGAGTLTAIVDPENTLTEAREDNNTATRSLTVTALKPDLAIAAADVTHTPTSPGSGRSITVRATVKNVGTAGAQNVKVVLKRGTTTLATKTKTSLSAGGSYTATMTWTLPSGAYEPVNLTVVADPDRAVDELDETNNEAGHTITPAKPDLSVTASEFTHRPATPLAGTEVRLSVKVRNMGAAKAQSILLRVVNHDVVLAEQTISSLSSGASSTRTVYWDVPADLGEEVMLKAIVDPANAIPESDESNNSATHEFTITPRRIDLLLAAADITHSPADPQANHTVRITAKAHNTGNVKATSVKVRFFNGGVQIGEKTISYISAGSTKTTTLSWKLPATATGTITVQVKVDPDNTITESSEGNNSANHNIPVAASDGDSQ